MSNAKDLMKKLGGTGGGFLKPSAKPVIAAPEAEKKAGRPAGKHFDADQKGHNMKGKGPGAGASVPTSVRPKV